MISPAEDKGTEGVEICLLRIRFIEGSRCYFERFENWNRYKYWSTAIHLECGWCEQDRSMIDQDWKKAWVISHYSKAWDIHV